MYGGYASMALGICRRYKLFFVVFIVISTLVVCIKTQTVSGLFKDNQDNFCDNEDCSEGSKTVDVAGQENTDPAAGGLGSQPLGKIHESTIEAGKEHDESKENSPINLLITFTNAAGNGRLQQKFTLTVSSLLAHASVPIAIHVIGDGKSQEIAADILKKASVNAKSTYTLVQLDVDHLAMNLDEIVRPMQDHFSYKPGAYYNHALFFLSIGIHMVMPENMTKVVMIDCDLKFKADIKELYDRFELFTKSNILAIGRDMQPVYRHTFWSYRRKHPGTRVGEPPPNGLTGFNSGVLLLDLTKMRNSELYNSLLNREALEKLAGEFEFKGHLGDQDFFSLLSMKYEKLFHVLPCNWNRQLCIWWKDKGYQDVFDLYFRCDGPVKIYHGNCGTPIPDD